MSRGRYVRVRMKKRRRIRSETVKNVSFMQRQFSRIGKLNRFVVSCGKGVLRQSAGAAYYVSVSMSLWCVNKLLHVSQGFESLIGAERPKQIKTNGTIPQANGRLKLSRPLNKIIEDTFKEEFTKLNQNIPKPSLQSEIQKTHQEIINALEQILIESEAIKTKLLGKENAMDEVDEIRVLTLNHGEHQDSTLYRIEKGWGVQFRLGPSLLGKKVSLYCNYPRDGIFKRNQYYQLQWCQDEGCSNSDDTALSATIKAKISGSFHYYFTYDNKDSNTHQGSGFFLVDPVIKYGNNEVLPLDCVQVQTVLAKSLGDFDKWEGKLRVSKESGYNMIHFTPIQELGDSNSSYSLKEQLKLNPLFSEKEKITYEDVKKFIAKLRSEWKMTAICDIVLNHTANESPWLLDHPEATYNCKNCPYMRPAYLLDAALYLFNLDVAKGVYESRGAPSEINCEDHLCAIRYILQSDVLSKLKLQEMYICDVNKLVSEFALLARSKVPRMTENGTNKQLHLIQDPEFRRMATKIDMDAALYIYNVYRNDSFDEETRIKKCTEEFKSAIDALNQTQIDMLNDDLRSAVENCVAGIRYFRVQSDGPRLGDISQKDPLLYRYFTDFGRPKSMEDYEKLAYGPDSKYLMAHNGWVMDSDPLANFASDAKVYLRRELIAWGDSVKLRYGDKPEDCPFLWKHMREYVEKTASVFDGVRLDNCHSTPIPVAEYLLDCARIVRPDLYVIAELFTNSDHKDNIFVNRLGITSLIREAMSAWDSHEEGRLVYRYGGYPVGAFYQPKIRPLTPSVAHALFLDLSHDNPSPVEKRSVFDLLPSAALVNMACCASGSNRGYDELVPHHIHVVDETREYTEWSEKDQNDVGFVSQTSGIIAAKRAINDLHFYLGSNGYNQIYVDQMDADTVAVTRHNPMTHDSVILVAYTAFKHPQLSEADKQRYIKPLRVEGELIEIILEASLSNIKSKYEKSDSYVQDNKYINGYSDYKVDLRQHIALASSQILIKGNSGDCNVLQLDFKNFKPGSVVAIKVALNNKVKQAIKTVRGLSNNNNNNQNDLRGIIKNLNLADLNRVLYRCDQEERDDQKNFNAYDIPNFGTLVYCGLQGFMSLLSNIRPNNDLGHPMCVNLRAGNWMIDYIWGRLKVNEGTVKLGSWFEKYANELKICPRYLIPAYFDLVITGVYLQLLERCYELMSDFVRHGSVFVRGLALGSLQFAGVVISAQLPMLSPKLAAPKPSIIDLDGRKFQNCVSLSAGLPHFATGYMRNWGRDTFIALRGMFILTGRYQEARYHILAYAACLRHGLIPNLLDGGKNSRFNCRDAVWWWLHCIQCYVQEAPNGLSILQDKVSRIFPNDEATAQEVGVVDQPLCDVMQEALTVHFQGLVFKERNAGREIDEHMTDRGFNNQIGVHPDTGFIFGGNSANCGTWMDKMGSSDKAGIRGKPATPRDGSAVELIGLSMSVITFLAKLSFDKKYPYDCVERKNKNGTITKWTLIDWATKIQTNFEKHFWVGENAKDTLLNHRKIYKDCCGASQAWTDYQLRCNFPIAMVVAPELFDPNNAWSALKMAEEHLLGPLGMKTLDSTDWNYCGDYDNSNDSTDPKVAHGFNYHQGPEWVWPVGFFLRARLIFAAKVGQLKPTIASTKEILVKHFVEMQTSDWRGLPELTNTNGSYCKDSSRTQAWSMSCILEVLYDLQRIESKAAANIN